MKGLRFYGDGRAAVEDVPVPEPKKGEVLLRTAVSALCGSEHADYLAGLEEMPGHEFAGIVEETNGCGMLKPGDQVTVNVIKGCGNCYFCKKGQPQFCSSFSVLSGGHAEYAAVPEQCCIRLPEGMEMEVGVLLGGDTLGVAYRAIGKIRQDWARNAAVFGAGPIGLGVISLLKYYGYHVSVWEPNPIRRQYALDLAGADEAGEAYDPESEPKADVVFECSGNAAAELSALEGVRPAGTVVFCGENYRELKIVPSYQIIHREVTLTGAFYYTRQDFYDLCEIYYRGFDPRSAVSHIFPLEEAPEACRMFFGGKTVKVLLKR